VINCKNKGASYIIAPALKINQKHLQTAKEQPSLQYRVELDGLRALAVLPVIFFHGGLTGFSGGYIGVDIFFVISGYLITSIILSEKAAGRFSLLNFYERRARRILPALSSVLLLSTLAAYFWMTADQLRAYSQSLVSVMTFSSNIFFYLTSGYFEAASEQKPLLHTWSLSVEEQYYLFFPVLIMLLWPLGKKWLISAIFLIATLSLLCSQVLLSQHALDANFYLIFSRAWELMLGSLIAFVPLDQLKLARWHREVLSLLGLVAIAYAMVFFDNTTPFPSVWALIPVLGTCLVIMFTQAKTWTGRFLAHPILVSLGLMSYSLYLWHQPLFAFVRMNSIGEPGLHMFGFAMAGTLVLAFLSWKYVEQPFRNKARFSRAMIFKCSLASMLLFSALGLTGHVYQGFEGRFQVPSYTDSVKYSPKRVSCHTQGVNYLPPNQACRYHGNQITWAVLGDSHVVEPAYALAQKLAPHGLGLLHLSFSSCPPARLFEASTPGCSKWLDESLQYLRTHSEIQNILLGFRYSAFLYGDQLKTYPHLPDENPANHFADAHQQLSATDAREWYWKSFVQVVTDLLEANKTVYILYPIPELPLHINQAIKPFSVSGSTPRLNLDKVSPFTYYAERNAFILKKLDTLPYAHRLHAIKPSEQICDQHFCAAVRDGKALYFDDDHLSLAGAEWVLQNLRLDSESFLQTQK